MAEKFVSYKEMMERRQTQIEKENKRTQALWYENRNEFNLMKSQLRETSRKLAESKLENIKLGQKMSNLKILNDKRSSLSIQKTETKKLQAKINELKIEVEKYKKMKWIVSDDEFYSYFDNDSRIDGFQSVLDCTRFLEK